MGIGPFEGTQTRSQLARSKAMVGIGGPRCSRATPRLSRGRGYWWF